MRYGTVILTMIVARTTMGRADMGFDDRYERDYNIFNPINGAITETAMVSLRWPYSRYCSTEPAVHTKCGMDAPFNPINRYDPGNPANPINQYQPNNPFNPVNRYRPDNPFNPINKYNPTVPFAPLDGGNGHNSERKTW